MHQLFFDLRVLLRGGSLADLRMDCLIWGIRLRLLLQSISYRAER